MSLNKMSLNKMSLNKISSKTAVIVIDLQNDYVDENGFMGKALGTRNIQKILPKVETFLAVMRKNKLPLIHIQMTEDAEKIAFNLKKKRLEIFGTPENWSLATPGTWGHQLVLTTLPEEAVFQKNTYDLFSNSELKEYLKQREIDTLIILGGYTHACVDTSVRSGVTLGYEVILATDLVASPDLLEEAHQASLKVLTQLFAYGLTSEEIIKLVNSEK